MSYFFEVMYVVGITIGFIMGLIFKEEGISVLAIIWMLFLIERLFFSEEKKKHRRKK